MPWSWAITPLDTSTHKCPSFRTKFGAFASENFASAFLTMIISHSGLINYISCGLLGKDGAKTWRYMWISSVGLHIGANALNAWISVSAKGYDRAALPAVGDLTLFYMLRSRMTLFALYSTFGMMYGSDTFDPVYYITAIKQACIAEVPLQMMALYYCGRIVHFAASEGYFTPGRAVPQKKDFMTMSVGALAFLICTGLLLTMSIALLWRHFKKGWSWGKPDRRRFMHDCTDSTLVKSGLLWSFSGLLCLWLVFGGFLGLAGDRYCPPKLTLQTAVWVLASVIGAATSTSW